MNAAEVEQALAAHEALAGDGGDRGLAAVRAALFLEEVLGVRVGDDDIRELAADPGALRRLAARPAGRA